MYIGRLGRIYDDGAFISRGIKDPIVFAYKTKEIGITLYGIPLFINKYYQDIFTHQTYSSINNVYYPEINQAGKIVFKGLLLYNYLSVGERAKGYFTHEEAIKYLEEMNAMYEEDQQNDNKTISNLKVDLGNAKKVVEKSKNKAKIFLKSFNWKK